MTNKSVLLRVSITTDDGATEEPTGVVKLDADQVEKMGFAFGDKDVAIISTCHEYGRVMQATVEMLKQFHLEES